MAAVVGFTSEMVAGEMVDLSDDTLSEEQIFAVLWSIFLLEWPDLIPALIATWDVDSPTNPFHFPVYLLPTVINATRPWEIPLHYLWSPFDARSCKDVINVILP